MLSDKDLLNYIHAYGTLASDDEKKAIIEKIRCIKREQFKYLLQYGEKGYYWQVQAEIIIALGYPIMKPVMVQLFEWLKDMCWPGATDIQDRLLIKLDKPVLASCLDTVLRKAFIESCDTAWMYTLSRLVKKANLSREDFSQTDNAFDIVLCYDVTYGDDETFTFNYIDLFQSWGYPRIRQFMPNILYFLVGSDPNTLEWKRKRHKEILELVPDDVREIVVKEGLRFLHNFAGVNEIGNLAEIVPIGRTTEAFQNYISQ